MIFSQLYVQKFMFLYSILSKTMFESYFVVGRNCQNNETTQTNSSPLEKQNGELFIRLNKLSNNIQSYFLNHAIDINSIFYHFFHRNISKIHSSIGDRRNNHRSSSCFTLRISSPKTKTTFAFAVSLPFRYFTLYCTCIRHNIQNSSLISSAFESSSSHQNNLILF